MMRIRKKGKRVDVLEQECSSRPCLVVGSVAVSVMPDGHHVFKASEKHRKATRLVCMTRHENGCPVNSACGTCLLASVRAAGGSCPRNGCGGTLSDVSVSLGGS